MMRVFMRLLMTVVVRMLVGMIAPLLVAEDFARQVFLATGVDVHFGRGNSASLYPRYLQPGSDIERCDCVFQKLWRHSGIYQRA